MADWLAHQPLLAVVLVLAGGFLLGEVSLPGRFRLGPAAVLFTGLGVGAFVPGLALPPELERLGLALFVYCLGLQVGPGFLAAFRRGGGALPLALAAATAAVALGAWAWGILAAAPPAAVAGLYAGVATHTASLGAALEVLDGAGAPPDRTAVLSLAYALLYPAGVLLTLVHLRLRGGPEGEAAGGAPVATELPRPATYRVPARPDGTAWSGAGVRDAAGIVLTRFAPPGGREPVLVAPDTGLVPGGRLVAVGDGSAHERLRALGFPPEEEAPLHDDFGGFRIRRFFVSRRELVGRPLSSLGLERQGAVVTRLRRGDLDLPVTPTTCLQLGDRVRVLHVPEREAELVRLFGNSLAMSTENGTLSFFLGLLGGLLVGLVPWAVPGLPVPLQLGAAGGPLAVGLLLGRLGRTGPFVWQLPLTVNLSLRQFGLAVFLAGAGLRAGAAWADGIPAPVLSVLLPGLALLALGQLLLVVFLRWARRGDRATVLGALAAFQTQPAALALAARLAPAEGVHAAYAAAYPLAFVLKLVVVQLLVARGL